MKQLILINPENVSTDEANNYTIRHAARAIVVDGNGNIALLHVVNEGYYKLPGGGIEENEDKIRALVRECREEIGYEIEVLSEIGQIVEYRKIPILNQVSYCYIAKIKGSNKELNLTEEEIMRGTELIWITYSEAIRLFQISKPESFICSAYIVPRDLAFLKEAKNLF